MVLAYGFCTLFPLEDSHFPSLHSHCSSLYLIPIRTFHQVQLPPPGSPADWPLTTHPMSPLSCLPTALYLITEWLLPLLWKLESSMLNSALCPARP